jgi:hypothetical protein
MASSTNTFSRYVLPVVLFVAIIAGITWMANYHSVWRRENPGPVPPPNPVHQEYLEFSRPGKQAVGPVVRAVFEIDPAFQAQTPYFLEMEQGKKGRYYFPFRNVFGAPVDFNIEAAACDCTDAYVAILPDAQWQKINEALDKEPWAEPPFETEPNWQFCDGKQKDVGITIPKDGCCLLRVAWHARKAPGDTLNLDLKFWSQPSDKSLARVLTGVTLPVIVVPPIMFDPLRLSGIRLGPGDNWESQLFCMSATRKPDELHVAFRPDRDDSLLEVSSRPLTTAETADLEDMMRKKTKQRLRIRSAVLLTVKLHESVGKTQMDQGPFMRTVSVMLDEIPVDNNNPTITGTVKGPVDVGGEEDNGKIDLKTFPTSEAKSVVIPVYADPERKLELGDCYPRDVLQVALKALPQDPRLARTRYDLKVTVPAGAWRGGPLPLDARVELRMVGTDRRVRIPVVGIGTRGRS